MGELPFSLLHVKNNFLKGFPYIPKLGGLSFFEKHGCKDWEPRLPAMPGSLQISGFGAMPGKDG